MGVEKVTKEQAEEEEEEQQEEEEEDVEDVFAAEWEYVLKSNKLSDNQRNGYLLRVEERAVYRFIRRIAVQALFSTKKLRRQRRLVKEKEEEKKREKDMEAEIAREVLEEMIPIEDQVLAEMLSEQVD